MDKSDIHLYDIQRILFGNAPAEFLIETLFRTVIIYIFLLMIVKWLGKRMAGQLTITELGITIMLGAIVSPPMEAPERGIIQGIFILFMVLLFHQWVALAAVTNRKAERIIKGKLSIFVKDGILQIHEIESTGVSRAQLISALREKEIYNLGKVKRMYLEACGIFSIFKEEKDRPGLSMLPVGDESIHSIQKKPDQKLIACTSCGNTVTAESADALSPEKLAKGQSCNICGSTHWDVAIL